ncbi:MAG: hypothetical protein FJX65_13670 [Alphaproteobacteria bacterium]|nr:hypothetical protein [Alphaproteobacteria bacterium]
MLGRLALTLGLGLCLGAVPLSPVAPQTRVACLPHEHLVDALLRTHQERPTFVGLTARGDLMEVFTSLDTGTWTIVVTSPRGISCLLVDGDSWEPAKLQSVAEPKA